MAPRLGRGIVALALGLVGFGCGGGSGASPGPESEDALPTHGVYGRVAPAAGGVPSVVMLVPEGPAPEASEGPVIDQLGLQFSPRFVIAAPGREIRFTNSESIAHNVIVRPAGRSETLLNADTPSGGSASLALEAEGAYDVTCEIHPGMTGLIFVTPAPYATFAEADGSFSLPGVPPGSYALRIWNAAGAELVETTVEVREGVATEVVATGMD